MCFEMLQYEINASFILIGKKFGIHMDESDNEEEFESEEENGLEKI